MTAMKFDKSIVSNPKIFKQNRVDAHSGHSFYSENCMRSLNGVWKVFVAKNPSLVPDGFYREDFDVSGFSPINVPAHIQTEGFDKNAYVNYQYPWDGVEDVKPGEIPTEYNPVACYVNFFDVEKIMPEQKYHICFDGVESNIALFINGQYVGYAEDAFTTSEFDITDYIREGKNKLAALVYKWCSSCFVDDQDFFRFSGIFRDVTLVCHPICHLNDIKVVTDLDEEYKDATLDVSLKFTGLVRNGLRLSYKLFGDEADLDYKSDYESGIISGEIELTDNIFEYHISKAVKAPKKWSAEKPYLYVLEFELRDENDELIEESGLKVGFRKFEMIDGIMCINGKRIVFNGVNRHEFSATTGRAISYEETEYDIVNMKRNNINALRTSHYPNAEFLYDLCDEYGLYVICENNMESHGSWANIYAGMTTKEQVVPGDNEDFKELIIDRAISMVEKEKNHPSILIWSCGNESFGGSNIWEMSEQMRRLDPTRLIHYESIFHDRRYPDTSDMESQMYPSVNAIKKFLSENLQKPFICCEYTHAMGNSCGAMYKYTDLAREEKRYQGGFIWDYIDQAIETENIFGEKYYGYGGDFSDRPCDYEFSGDGICYADRTDSPKMPSVKYNYQPAYFSAEKTENGALIHVKNLNLFTDFTEYDFVMTYEVDGETVSTDLDIDSAVCSLAPSEEAVIPVEFDTEEFGAGIYTATIYMLLSKDTNYAEAGFPVAFYQYREDLSEEIEKKYTLSEKENFRVIKGGYNIGVRGENFSVLFSALNGGLTSYVHGGKEYIDVIPKPNFWRAPTDNDRGNQMPFRYAQWKAASLYQMFRNPGDLTKSPYEICQGENQVTVSYTYYLPTVNNASVKVSYTVYPDGEIKVNMNYSHVKGLIDMPEFGMLLKLPADLKNVTWLGLGPQETYSDRTQGAYFGWFHNEVSDNFAKYLRPQECGNKMDVYEAMVTNDKGKGIRFSGKAMNFSALPYTPEEIECALHPYELKRSDHTVVRVSLMQMGVGGDDTWGALTHPEFLLPKDTDLDFEFSFKGI